MNETNSIPNRFRRLSIAEDSMYDWKKRFDLLVRQYEIGYDKKDRFNLKGLYIELDQLGKHLIKTGRMADGTTYDIPFEDGSRFSLTCHLDSTEVIAFSEKGESMVLMNKNDSVKKEYGILEAYSFGHSSHGGIGHRYPDALAKWLNEDVKVGQIISFDHGQVAYVCTRKKDLVVDLKKIYVGDDMKKATVEQFMDAKTISLTRLGDGPTALYNEVKSSTLNVFSHMEMIDDFAQQTINGLYSVASKKHVATIAIGNETLRLKKSMIGNRYTWYGKSGIKLDENSVKAYIAWVHSTPVKLNITRIEREGIDDLDALNNELGVRAEYEKQLIENNYSAAVSTLVDSSEFFKKEFSISLDSFAGMEAVSFSFKLDNEGRCHIMRTDYEPGNTDEPSRISELSNEELAKFLDDRYKNCRAIEYRHSIELLQSEHPKATDIGKKVLDDEAIKRAEEREYILKKTSAVIDKISPDIYDLVESYVLYSWDRSPDLTDSFPGRHEESDQSDNRKDHEDSIDNIGISSHDDYDEIDGP